MAYGAVLKFSYEGLLALLYYFFGDWRSFEGWAAAEGVNPQKLSGRRMLSLMFYFIERDMDDKGREKFRHSLENITSSTPKSKQIKTDKPTYISTEKKKWRAEPGWTPPGWDENKSYAASMAFMGFKANPK